MKQFIVDAFTDKVFHGNPAAVCILDHWLRDELMLQITCENNLSETAFAVKEGNQYHLRWFTPGGEIDLCGHATLATAFVIMNYYESELLKVEFATLSGILTVTRQADMYAMDFPAYDLQPVMVTDAMSVALGVTPKAAYMGRDLLCVLDSEMTVRELTPNLERVKELEGLLLHVTARVEQQFSDNLDCVSRSFAPKLNVSEDPVCGSGHCHIVPYWAKCLGKDNLVAYQASKRGGTLYCSMNGHRVTLAGKASLYAIAELNIL